MELDPQESPGEIKNREVELDPQESPGEIKNREVELDPQESPGEIKSREVELDPQESPGEIKNREVELGSHRELDNRLLQLLLNSCYSDTETAISGSTQVASHWRGPHLLNIVVLAVADGLFGLCGSERLDKLFMSSPYPHLPLFSRP